MKSRPFIQCDVFSSTPTKGNALAVVLDGEGLSAAMMQNFARWTQLAETTFVLPATSPEADYALHIWTPHNEMKFAGHPTLGSAVAWLQQGGQPREKGIIRQQCGIGIVVIDVTGERPAFIAPPTKISAQPEAFQAQIAEALGLAANSIIATAHLDNGPEWWLFELATAAEVLALDLQKLTPFAMHGFGFLGRYPEGARDDYEVRMVDAWHHSVIEDPITGSLNAAIAHWLDAHHRLDGPITIGQGQARGREGRVYIDKTPQGIFIGGDVNILVEGQVFL